MCLWLEFNQNEYRPPVNPPKEIDDPDDKKPSDWDEREKLVYIYCRTKLSFYSI